MVSKSENVLRIFLGIKATGIYVYGFPRKEGKS